MSNAIVEGTDNFIKRNLLVNFTQFSGDADDNSNSSLPKVVVNGNNNVTVTCNSSTFEISTIGCFGKFSVPSDGDIVADIIVAVTQNNGGDCVVNWDLDMAYSLVYIDDVISAVRSSIQCVQEIPTKYVLTGRELLGKVRTIHQLRQALTVPEQFGLDKYLYATYLTYLPLDAMCHNLHAKSDQRGSFYEVLKTARCGQVAISTTNPTYARGNHWHNTKIEKFLVLRGQAEVLLRLVDGIEVVKFVVSSEVPQVVEVPPGYVHSIVNTGTDELLLLIWGSELFDVNNPDTYAAEV